MNAVYYNNKVKFLHLLKNGHTNELVSEDNYFIKSLNSMLDSLKFFHSNLLIHCSEDLQNDKEIVTQCIKMNPFILEIVKNHFKQDKELVYDAFLRNSLSLEFAHESLKDDEHYMRNIFIGNEIDEGMKRRHNMIEAFRFVSKRLQGDRDFVIDFLDNYKNMYHSSVVECIDQKLYADKEIIVPAIKISPIFIKKIPMQYQEDKNFILELINKQYNVYPHLVETLQKDRDIIKATLATNPIALNTSWYRDKLNNDKELVLIMLNRAPRMYKNVNKDLMCDREVIIMALKHDGRLLDFIPEKIVRDRELLFIALTSISGKDAYDELPANFKNDQQFMCEVLKLNPSLIRSISYDTPELLNDAHIIFTFLSEGLYKKVSSTKVEDDIGKDLLNNMNVSLDLSQEERIEKYLTYLSKIILGQKLDRILPKKENIKNIKKKI